MEKLLWEVPGVEYAAMPAFQRDGAGLSDQLAR